MCLEPATAVRPATVAPSAVWRSDLHEQGGASLYSLNLYSCGVAPVVISMLLCSTQKYGRKMSFFLHIIVCDSQSKFMRYDRQALFFLETMPLSPLLLLA